MLRWIDGRKPSAVMALEPWVRSVQEVPDPDDLPLALSADGRAALDRAVERTGRVRESAFHLLVADALLTYACEAALDADDPEGSLRSILAAILAK